MARPPLALLAGLAACAAVPFLVGAVAAESPGPGGQDPAAETALDPPSILVSRQLAASEGLQVGDVVRFASEPSGAGALPFRIADTYEPTPDPMRAMSARHEARFHLPHLLALTADPADPLGEESVDAINIALADPAEAFAFASDLRAQLPGLLIEPTARDTGPTSTFAVIERFHVAVAVVTVVASSLFLLALMVMRVNERRETIGTLRLIGVPTRRLALHVVAEGLLVAVAGALFGLLLAVTFEGAFNRFFQWRYDTALVFVRITPTVAWRAVALSVPLGLLASVAASWPLLRAGALTLVRR